MKILLALVLLLPASWITVAPAAAQDTSVQSQQCRSAFSAAENLLVNGRNLWVTNPSTYSIGEVYDSHPYQSSVGITIGMAGGAAPDMMSSPRLLTMITETIISGCPSIGLVTFVVANTDWAVDFGLIGN